jgi:CrcB protein
MLNSILAVSVGAAIGAVLRWLLSIGLNGLLPTMPPGTLAANLIGAYLIGLIAALLLAQPAVSAEWRLFLVTGFLGGLTTFSTFSLEVFTLLQQQRYGWAASTVTAHLFGSLLLTALGFATVSLWRRLFS